MTTPVTEGARRDNTASFLASRGFAAQRSRARALPLLNPKNNSKQTDCKSSQLLRNIYMRVATVHQQDAYNACNSTKRDYSQSQHGIHRVGLQRSRRPFSNLGAKVVLMREKQMRMVQKKSCTVRLSKKAKIMNENFGQLNRAVRRDLSEKLNFFFHFCILLSLSTSSHFLFSLCLFRLVLLLMARSKHWM